MHQRSNIPSWLVPSSFLFYLILNVICWKFPFFWDTLLTSTICSYFYDNGFATGIPHSDIDAGHPPLFYGYILLWWKVLGKNLLVSHLAMLPILWIMVYQFIHLADRLLNSKWQVIAATLLLVFETTIIAQSTMVSYDIAILCFYLFGLRYLLDHKKAQVLVAGMVLSLVSLRGAIAFGTLFLTEIILFSKDRKIKHILPKYLPAVMLFAGWNLWHLNQSGWMLFTPSEHWTEHRGFVDIKGMLRNILIIIRNLLEPGRLLLYFLIFIGWMTQRKKMDSIKLKTVMVVLLMPLVVFSLFFIPFSNPIGHRYLMIIFALSILLFVMLINEFKLKNILFGLAISVMISGHFWYKYYPASISKGWDSSLEHLSYFEARKKMWNYINQNGISFKNVMADFPIDVSMHQSNLEVAQEKPQKWAIPLSHYVIISNVNNDFSTSMLDSIRANYLLVKKEKSSSIELELYRKHD